jgi:uncharacterized protein
LAILGSTTVLVAAIVGLQLGFSESSLLYLAPALLFLGPLVFGRYPGERLLRAVIDRPRGRGAPATTPRLSRVLMFAPLPRGGALLASALAGRAPPRPPAARLARPSQPSRSDERKTTMRRIAFSVALLCSLALPGVAAAHVSLHPNEVPAGSFATLGIRVPNETDDANTTKVAVQFPPGFIDVSPEFMPGWTPKVITAKLAKPVQTDDGEVTEGVKEIVWSADKDAAIPPGQFLDFPISTEIPGKEGEELTFKTLQFYDNGEVVRWIGAADSEEPAPQIDVTAPGGVLQDVAGSETAPPAPGAAEGAASEVSGGEASASSDSSDSASKGLGIAALIVGALGLIAGIGALVVSRRSARGGATA